MNEKIKGTFNWPADVMNAQWNEESVLQKLTQQPEQLIADALLDQENFSGLGNLIRNEVLYRAGIHPMSQVGAIRKYKLLQIVREARNYSLEFQRWKKEGVLQMYWSVHRKEKCAKHDIPLKVKILGKAKQKAYYCEKCQTLYL